MTKLDLPERVESERLLIQRLRLEDAAEVFYKYASKPEVTKYLVWPTHLTIDETRAFLQYSIENWRLGVDYSYSLRIKNTNELVGGFSVMNQDGKAQFGYAIAPAYWGSGYATEACKRMMDMLVSIRSLYRICTFADVDNVASIRVLEKSGLVQEAKLKKWFRFVNQGNQPKDCVLFTLPTLPRDSHEVYIQTWSD